MMFAMIAALALQGLAVSENFEEWQNLSYNDKLKTAAEIAFSDDNVKKNINKPLYLLRLPAPTAPDDGGEYANVRYALVTLRETGAARSEYQAYLSVFYLDWVDGEFTLSGEWDDLVPLGEYDEDNVVEGRKTLLSAPAILAKSGGIWQGCEIQNTQIVAFVDQGPRIVAEVQTYFSDGGAEEDRQTSGSISALHPGKSFLVSYSGAINRQVTWERAGGKYYPVENVDIGGC